MDIEFKHIPELGFNISECGTRVNRYIEAFGRFFEYRQKSCRNDYKRIQIVINGKRKTFGIHRLVAMAFIGVPENYREMDVNHKDGNKSNNHYSNLEWVTHKENMYHAKETGLVTILTKRTHCRKGHPLSGTNLRIQKDKRPNVMRRVCRACEKVNQARFKEKRRMAA